MYIPRQAENLVREMLSMFKVVLVTGPRQVGKTTLLKHLLGEDYTYVTLDDINALDVAKSDPKLFFFNYPGKIIIDEVQYAPELFREIKRLVDESDEFGTIVLTGSQTFSLMNNVSETLAGRIGILELNGLSLREIRRDPFSEPVVPDETYLNSERVKTMAANLWETIHRGSMPELYRNTDMKWQLFYAAYVKTYIERDVRLIINVKDLNLFAKFMVALAARTGQLLNHSAISNELGVEVKTIKSWTSVLETSGIIALVQPFSNNRLTRTVKTPMLYFMDTGLVCYLLNWLTPGTLMNGAMSGQILETFAVSEIIKSFKNNGVLQVPLFFYRDKDMYEIDIIIERSGVLYPMEVKKSATPKASMGRHLSIVDKAEGYTTGKRVILCLVDRKIYLNQEIIAYPISQL